MYASAYVHWSVHAYMLICDCVFKDIQTTSRYAQQYQDIPSQCCRAIYRPLLAGDQNCEICWRNPFCSPRPSLVHRFTFVAVLNVNHCTLFKSSGLPSGLRLYTDSPFTPCTLSALHLFILSPFSPLLPSCHLQCSKYMPTRCM